MKYKFKKIIVSLSFVLLFISFFHNYLSFKLWDYDFWWHLATGRYIVENGALPDKDPFSFAYNLDENEAGTNPAGQKFNLQQYWLSQILFYKIYAVFGDAGIIFLRSLLLLMTLIAIFLWMRRRRVVFFIMYPLIFFAFLATLSFFGERPVLFTILFSVIIFYILDEFSRNESKAIFLAVPLMLLWANIHGGFILGVTIIGAFMAGETINFMMKKEGTSRKKLLKLFLAGFAAIGISWFNPNGFKAFLALLPDYQVFASGTQEYYSPFTLYKAKVTTINWGYILLVMLFPITALLRGKRMDLSYFLLLLGLFYMSTQALRFIIFYSCIGSMVLAKELHDGLEKLIGQKERTRLKFESAATLLLFCSSLLFAGGGLDFGKINFGKAVGFSVPEKAADFVKANDIKGNIFNDMGSGGYLTWRLYPQKKIFIDTRALNYTVVMEHGWILNAVESIKNPVLPEGKKPLWERLLDHYEINLIVFNTVDAMGTIQPVIFELVKSESWIPVFHDLISVVFVRNNEENKDIIEKYRLSGTEVYDALIARFTTMALQNRDNPNYMLSAGDVFYNMERYEDAVKAYEYADKRLPGRPFIEAKIGSARKKMAEGRRNNEVKEKYDQPRLDI